MHVKFYGARIITSSAAFCKASTSASSVPIEISKPQVVTSGNAVTAPMPGKILRILVNEGEKVKVGQGLLVLEAMKMENEIPAPKDDVIIKILVNEGETVDTGQPLIELR